MGWITLLALAALVFISPDQALAHARLVRSNPAKKAELVQAPGLIELWFNELLDEGFNSIEVFPVSELNAKKPGNLAKGKAQVDPKDRTRLTIEVGPLAPGEYVVQWRVLSRDGHSAPGRFTFRVLESK